MKKFSDLRVGDEIYVFLPPDDVNPYTILGISTLSSGNLIFKLKNDFTIIIKKENINKSISIPEDILIYVDLVITDPRIAEWF